MDDKLTPKQRRFVEEYLIDMNGTQAAIRAGYNPNSANEQSSQMLAKLNIQSALQRAREEQSLRTNITADMVLAEYAKLAFSNMLDYTRIQDDGSAYVDLSNMTRDQAAALSEISVDEYTEGRGDDVRPVKHVKIKIASKQSALDSLAKHLGVLIEKHEFKMEQTQDADQLRRAIQDELAAFERISDAGVLTKD